MHDRLIIDSSPTKGTLLIPDDSSMPFSNVEGNTAPAAMGDSPISPTSTTTRARFEFEMGRGNEGSKVLMVEWDCSYMDGRELSARDREGWEVSWEGKSTAYPLRDDDPEAASMLRVYFLLPENAPIPPAVTICHAATERTLTTKCMPAIFAPGLGVSPPDSGKRGVLHTIWAKKRRAELQAEIDKELQTNSEGVALEMAIQERGWLVDHFGLIDLDAQERPMPLAPPYTPRSPVGGRLGEMLRGLKLTTSSSNLARTPGDCQPQAARTFSRDISNMGPVPTLSAPRIGSGAAVASLDAVIISGQHAAPIAQTRDTEDELFALPMSPRSPEMTTSPFSLLK
ncbi:hypothetical protein GGR50DRAFT_293381 [Xylaria sp. CBS 124048]|nr:hypothetical protein GGR50DRAFT_293381 [Xylaria sp. CBS 124048]